MSNDEMHEIKAQQDELSRKLNEKISGDKFQKAMASHSISTSTKSQNYY
jgi:hypothetical protein